MGDLNKLKNEIQGQYQFSNEILIDVNCGTDNHIKIHEYVHRVVTGASTIGILLMMMKKASLIDTTKDWLFDIILDSSNRLQEQVATNVEYMYILEKYGIDKYRQKINELSENKKYKKYFDSLSIINKNVTTPDEARQAINRIILAGILSLNIDLTKFPLWEFNDKKDFQRHISIEGNNFRFNPNSRFKVLVKFLCDFKNIEGNNKEINLVESTTYGLDRIDDLSRETVNKIYRESKWRDSIRERVNCMKLEYQELDQEILSKISAYPVDLNTKIINHKFEISDLATAIKSLKENNNMILEFEHRLAGLEHIPLLSYWRIDENKSKVALYNDLQIKNIIKEIQNPVIFVREKLFKKIGVEVMKYLNFRPLYIVMDSSLNSNLNFICDEFKNEKFAVLEEEKYDILVFIKKDIRLIQLIGKNIINDCSFLFTEKNIILIKSNEIDELNKYLIKKIAKKFFNISNNVCNKNMLKKHLKS